MPSRKPSSSSSGTGPCFTRIGPLSSTPASPWKRCWYRVLRTAFFFHPDDEFAQQQRREGLSRGAPSGSGQSGGSLELGARGETVKHLWTHAGEVNRELVSALAWLWTK